MFISINQNSMCVFICYLDIFWDALKRIFHGWIQYENSTVKQLWTLLNNPNILSHKYVWTDFGTSSPTYAMVVNNTRIRKSIKKQLTSNKVGKFVR